ncbi:MAG: DUF3800 domain-containing protein [Sphingobium sp.]|nr:DUF3800 domain-containing protein [Sphingobium sp.]
MPARYHVYIDEAGDPGVKPKESANRLRTDWFTVGAIVISNANDRVAVDWIRDMKEAVRCKPADNLHYRNLSETNQARVCRMLGRKPARLFVVASHKDSMRRHYNPRLGRANDKVFYNWCLRVLLERVTEWCYLRSISKDVADCSARIVFSERGGHNYGELRDYLRKLEAQCLTGNLVLKQKGIAPGVISDTRLEVNPNDDVAGLQLADITASAFFNAANSLAAKHQLDPARSLKPILAPNTKTGAAVGAGLTLLPFKNQHSIPEEDKSIFKEMGYKI